MEGLAVALLVCFLLALLPVIVLGGAATVEECFPSAWRVAERRVSCLSCINREGRLRARQAMFDWMCCCCFISGCCNRDEDDDDDDEEENDENCTNEVEKDVEGQAKATHIRLPSATRLRRISEYLKTGFRRKKRSKSMGAHNFWGLRRGQPITLLQEIAVDAAFFTLFVFITYAMSFAFITLNEATYDCGRDYLGFYCIRDCDLPANATAATCTRQGQVGIDFVKGINWMLLVTSLMSLVGSGFIVRSFFAKKKISGKLHLKLICSMAATDFMFALKFFFSSIMTLGGSDAITTNGEPACYVSAWLGQFFGLGTISWNFLLSVNLFLMVQYPFKYAKWSKSKKIFAGYHAYVWTFSLLTCVLAQATGHIGFTQDGTCWLTDSFIFWFYIPLYLYVCTAIFVVIFAANKLQVDLNETAETRSAGRKMTSQMVVFTMGFLASWFWGIVFRLQEYTSEDFAPSIYLTFTSSFFLGFQGFFNLIIWGDRVFSEQSVIIRTVCCRKKLFPRSTALSHFSFKNGPSLPGPKFRPKLKYVAESSDASETCDKLMPLASDSEELRIARNPLSSQSSSDMGHQSAANTKEKTETRDRALTVELPTMRPKRAVSGL